MADEESPWTIVQQWSDCWIPFGGNYATQQEAELSRAAWEPSCGAPLKAVSKAAFASYYEGRKALVAAHILENETYQKYSLLMRSITITLVKKLSLIELHQLDTMIGCKTVIEHQQRELTPAQQHADELVEAVELLLTYIGDHGTREDQDDENFVNAQQLLKTVTGHNSNRS
jgi:hypothetical protein